MAKQYDVRSFREAIQEHGANVTLVAEALGCGRSTVYSYMRKYPELKKQFEAAKGSAVDSRTQKDKAAVMMAVSLSNGVKASVAATLGVSRTTVDNYLQKWPDVAESFDAQKSSLISVATSALVLDVGNPLSKGHQAAYMFVLRTLGKDEGFTERTEVTGADGVALIPDETLKLAESLGMDMSAVAAAFQAMVRQEALKQGVLNE